MSHERKPNPSRYRLPSSGRAPHARNAYPVNSPQEHQHQAPPQSRNLRACLKHCQDCAGVCLRTITHCLALGGPHAAPDHQAVLHDCADICETVARFIARGSCCSRELARICADVCDQCAHDCDAIPGDDPMMRECAQTCRLCAETCASAARG